MKLLMRGVTAHQDRVASPMLRLLTEINKFNVGALSPQLYTSIDFTTKDLHRNLEPKKAAAQTATGEVITEDPNKPALRTVYIRFLLSFFHFGTTAVKQGLLSQRLLITATFKHIRSDPPKLISDLLETLKTQIVNNTLVPRAIKSQVFNEWVLGHISALYTRPEPVNENGDQSKTVAKCAHEFLLSLCTKPGVGGVCFLDNGWYPPSTSTGITTANNSESYATPSGKLFNRTLSSFLPTLKPFSDTLQQDLVLAIFTACPELIAPYFSSSTTYPFDPKLTATWIGYCAFLTSLIQLPLLKGGFGISNKDTQGGQEVLAEHLEPPPMQVVIESVLPKVCTRQVLTKCLHFENPFVRFLGTRLMVAAFQKLSLVISAIEQIGEQFQIPGSSNAQKWSSARSDLLEEFSRRMPDFPAVVTAYNSAPVVKDGQGGLVREVVAKLLMNYYTLLPEVALGKRFDVNIALGGFLEGGEVKGMRLLELEHLLAVAKEAGDVKWWGKGAGMEYSSFTLVLKLYLGGKEIEQSELTSRSQKGPSPKGIKRVLKTALDQTHTLQQETVADPFDALLESLFTVQTVYAKGEVFSKVLAFLDDCMMRCVRTPFKYLDELSQWMNSAPVSVATLPASPLIMALSEQLKFALESEKNTGEVKRGILFWFERFLENLTLLGESTIVLQKVAKRVFHLTSELSSLQLGFNDSVCKWYFGNHEIKGFGYTLHPDDTQEISSTRAIFREVAVVNLEVLEKCLRRVTEREMEITAFDIAVVLNGAGRYSGEDWVLEKVMALLGVILLQVKEDENESKELMSKTKAMVGGAVGESLLMKLLEGGAGVSFDKKYLEIMEILFDVGYESSLEPLVNIVLAVLPKLFVHNGNEPATTARIPILLRLISTLLPTEKLKEVLSTMIKEWDAEASVLYKVSMGLLNCFIERNILVDAETLLRLVLLGLQWENDEEILDSLEQYITRFDDIALLENIVANIMKLGDLPDGKLGMGKLVRRKPGILGELVKKVEVAKIWAINCLREKDGTNLGVYATAVLVSALLEISSAHRDGKYVWKDTVDYETRGTLATALERKKQEFVAPEFLSKHPEMLDVFRKTSTLFPEIEMEAILQLILKDAHRDTITSETVRFVSSLLASNTRKAKNEELKTAKKRWLLMMVDHLTRRFGEEKILSEKSTSLARSFAELVKENNIVLSEWVPRGSLNALLEAAVEKKIGVEEAIELLGVIVNKEDAKSLDLAKLLQMILGNSKNPLISRENGTEMVHYYMAWLIHRLFMLGKGVHSNVNTLDGVLVLYRGTCSIVDKLLLNIVVAIEGYLSRSCASRIASWTFLGDRNDVSVSSSNVLISRTKGSLVVTIDEEMLKTSVGHFAPKGANTLEKEEVEDWEVYRSMVWAENKRFEKQYDQAFILPVLGHLIAFKAKEIGSGQGMVEKGGVGYAIMGLSSEEPSIRTAAIQILSAIVARLEESIYRARNQISHLICALLASLEDSPIDSKPIPTVVTAFLSHAVQVLTDPSHFLYETIMEMLLRSPLLDIWDIPHMLATLGAEEDYYKEANWKLAVLAQGLRSETDLELYRKRRVFETVFAMYQNPYAGERTKERVIDLLWNLAEVSGGGTTAVTRNGVVGWIMGVLAKGDISKSEKTLWKIVVGRLVETSNKGHVTEWSRGMLGGHLDEIYRA